MTIDDKIRDQRLKYNINKETAKISALSCGKIDQYEYLNNKRHVSEQAKFSYSPLGKAFGKQTEKQVGAIESLDFSNKKNELKTIEGIFQ